MASAAAQTVTGTGLSGPLRGLIYKAPAQGATRPRPPPCPPTGADGDVAFAAVDLLGVVPARLALGTVAAARTDCESITAAVRAVCPRPGGPGHVAA
jgi:hypothetical protein